MYIKSISLKNFRCFEKFTLDFDEKLNVFFGENGSGKSSLFEAINILLGMIVGNLGKSSPVKTNLSYKDIRNESIDSVIEISIYDKEEITWGMSATKTIENGDFSITAMSHDYQLGPYVKKIVNAIVLNSKPLNLPIFLSYRSTRYTEYLYAKNEDEYMLSTKGCYDDAISINNNYSTFFKWFKAREDLELQKSKYTESQFDNQLQAVRTAIKKFYEFSDFRFDRELWEFVIEKNEKRVFYSQLSDGERGYILLIGDIARRLAIANPDLANPLNGEGIILIDEIELHLHPKWQRKIIPGLQKAFPNCQFLISSHSPQVLGEVPKESVWILEPGEEPYHPSRSYGMESSDLLREIMGAESRSPGVTELLVKIERLIEGGKFEEARRAISDLAITTGKIPALISANSYLTMMGQEQADIEE